MVNKNDIPLPRQTYTPIQAEVTDWFDLSANSSVEVLDATIPEQIVEVNKIGGRPEDSVTITVVGTASTGGGTQSVTEDVAAGAINSFGNVVNGGPFATDQLIWEVDNGSANDFTQADGANDPYQTHINYTIRDLTVLEKIRRDVSLTQREINIADEFDLRRKEAFGVPEEMDPVFETNFKDKIVVGNEAKADKFDIQNSGESSGVNIVTESNLQSRGKICYLTSIEMNTSNATFSNSQFNDDIRLDIERDGSDFFDLQTAALPGFTDNYETELFIPFLDEMEISAYSPNETPSDIEIQVEYKIVERTLIEKALYGLANETETDSQVGVYNGIRKRLAAGVGVQEFVENEIAFESGE